jgi:hypothetical protein
MSVQEVNAVAYAISKMLYFRSVYLDIESDQTH